jgi:N,N'-diacetyllegionaminate synthase
MHHKIIEHCQKHNIEFLSTGFDYNSIEFLDSLNIPFFKIPSGEITNKPYLQHIASKGKPVILSTGMANLGEIEEALQIFLQEGLKREQISILHCNTEYPTPMKDVNLKAMLTIKDAFKVDVGYSDHTLGIEIPIAAVALGAKVIEKHFTLDKTMMGPDHKASLEPKELKAMVQAIRNIELAISGIGLKEPSSSEIKNRIVARKSIVAACSIALGEIFTPKNLAVKRPGNGITPMFWDKIIGKRAQRAYQENELIEL